ncbi:hypothetical protein SRHO_G00114640 [Serrasalmus rhombeus]
MKSGAFGAIFELAAAAAAGSVPHRVRARITRLSRYFSVFRPRGKCVEKMDKKAGGPAWELRRPAERRERVNGEQLNEDDGWRSGGRQKRRHR